MLPMNAALVVIDVQQGFLDPSWGPRNNPDAEANIARLIAAWRRHGRPIRHVHHSSRSPAGSFYEGAPGHEPKPEAMPAPGEPIHLKEVNSGFIGTTLERDLRAKGAERPPMRNNPFLDSLHFLIGDTPDHNALGPAKYILVLLYAALLAGGIAVANRVWSHDPAQRTGRSLVILLFRMLIGTMWLEGSLWKLPLPVSGGFQYWTTQLTENSAFAVHAALVRDVFLAHIALLDPAVYLTETLLGAALMLGFAVRLAGLVGIAFTLNLWIGLYRNDAEWPWEYIFIIITHGFFVLDRVGQVLGLDALVRRAGPGVLTGPSLLGRAYRLAS